MEKMEIMSFEYAVCVFNEIATLKIDSYIPFEIIWNTSLGLAKAKTVIFDVNNRPVLKEVINYESIQQMPYNPGIKEYDLFSSIRHEVFNFFYDNFFGMKYEFLAKRPDLLMDKLLELSKIDISDEMLVPDYSIIFDFELVNDNLKLPFIHSDSIKIKEPISLISKN